VDLANRGDVAMRGVSVTGELLGRRAEASIAEPIEPGQTRSAPLHYALDSPRAGTHALTLVVDYQEGAQRLSQAAYLLLAIGQQPPQAVDVTIQPLRLLDMGSLRVRLRSRDGAAHSVRLRGVAPTGLQLRDPAADLDVPAQAAVEVGMTVFRGSAPRPSVQGVLVVAETEDGATVSSAVAAATVDVLPDPAWLPRLRWPLLGLAVGLLLAAVWAEWRRPA